MHPFLPAAIAFLVGMAFLRSSKSSLFQFKEIGGLPYWINRQKEEGTYFVVAMLGLWIVFADFRGDPAIVALAVVAGYIIQAAAILEYDAPFHRGIVEGAKSVGRLLAVIAFFIGFVAVCVVCLFGVVFVLVQAVAFIFQRCF